MFGEDITAYLPEHIKPFAEQLKQFPAGYEKWVYATAAPVEAYQGDVFSPVHFVSVDDDGDTIRMDCLGMVISNTCDAQPGMADFVLVAPVISLEDYCQKSDLRRDDLENHIRALVDNKISQLMFLPKWQEGSDSFVDFGNICSVSSRYFHSEHGQQRLVSLSQNGHYFLLVKLAYHLSRPETAGAKRG